MKDSIGDIMSQAKKVQEQMQKVQEELALAEVTGESGAGLVRVIMTGRHDVKKVDIDSTLLSENKEVVEDLLAAAVNDAVRKVDEFNKEKVSSITSGFPIPPGFKMPF
ncbi:MAG: YbaB/EbfC family nucleoid-associated protein [Pseudomonadales bacterium]|nr:YbaB/EbfC family nucleoid-associated protein [Pseudomonadales bacterium]